VAIEPPILKQIERLRSDIERAVPGFPRKYRYSVGATLREEIHAVARLANRAWRDRGQVRRRGSRSLERKSWSCPTWQAARSSCGRLKTC
jgi:hypothetical protein